MKRFTTRLSNSAPKSRLDDFIAEWLPTALGSALSKTKARTLILSGAVYVNRHRNKIPSTIIFGGAVLEVYFDESKLSVPDHAAETIKATIKQDHVLFEDEWLIVINKEPGIPTQPTIDPKRPNLFDLTKKYLQSRDKTSHEPYLGMHHRLDRDTSGIVMFTKKESANKGVAELFTQHRIQKTYHCLVWRTPIAATLSAHEEFEIKNFLGRVSAKNEIARFGSVKSNGDPAHTFFRVLEIFREAYWLEAKPKTGRTHQIRVHTSEAGLPIMGDPQYFPNNVFSIIKAPRLLLHAYQLEFDHPVTGLPVKIEAPLPDDFFKVLGILKS
jgi:23S rRNA pseudouridine1911/1915/1917 synthase